MWKIYAPSWLNTPWSESGHESDKRDGKSGISNHEVKCKRKAGEELQRSKGKSVRVEDSSEEGNKEHVYESVVIVVHKLVLKRILG